MRINRELKQWPARVLVALLLPGLSGCLTSQLWDSDYSNNDHRWASTNSPPRFYQTRDGKDVVVCYIERRDTDSMTRARAYLLYRNRSVVEGGHKPAFLRLSETKQLKQIPLVVGSPSDADPSDESLQAVLLPDQHHFTLVSKGREIGTYALPDYFGENRKALQIILTPLAVTGDAVIVGVAVVSIFGLIWLANGGWPEGKVVDSHWKP